MAPGKQWVTTLKKWMRLVIESPIIKVVGGKRGRRDARCGVSGLDEVEEAVSEGDCGRGDGVD